MSNPPFPGKVPKMDVIYMTRRQTPACERVSDQQYLDGVRIKPHCARHGGPWPDAGECPTKERPLGRPPLGTTGGPFPVG